MKTWLKIQIALVLGIAIGALFTWMLLSHESSERSIPLVQQQEQKSISSREKFVQEEESAEMENKEELVSEEMAQAAPIQEKQDVEIIEKDSVANRIEISGIDSVELAIEEPVQVDSAREEIIVKKELLIASYLVKIKYLTEDTTSFSATDSSLSRLSDIPLQASQVAVNVNFWQSPINYQGYKFGNRQLVLFGLLPVEDVQVLKLEKDFYLNYINSFYLLKETFEFAPYQPVIDTNIVKQLLEIDE